MPHRALHRATSLLCALAFVFPYAFAATLGTTPTGRQVPLLSQPGTRIAVLFFIASDCPVSNRYQPEMHRLEQAFSPRGVAFWFVYPNLTETPASIRAHRAAFATRQPGSGILIDPAQQLTRLSGAQVTPQAAILVQDPSRSGTLKPIYAGRIDDRYLSIGTERSAPTRHDLELALTAALTGSPIPPPQGPPVGCAIVSTR